MSGDIAIKVESISKTFKLPHEKSSSIKSSLINFRGFKKNYETQVALKNISFEVKRGEFFGVVGRNGSGKSTLLKLLAGIYTPDKGKIEINGKLTPFIELGVGFNPELSGRDNVYLNGALLGFSRKEMNGMYDEIVAFAELERFMDQKLKNYSSGMQVRLAFSIAIRANTDILVLDEVLAVGDANFQKKCFEVFNQIKREGRTVIFISHDMSAVKRYCDRVILLNNSVLQSEGTTDKIISEYMEINKLSAVKELARFNTRQAKNRKKGDNHKSAYIAELATQNRRGESSVIFQPYEKLRIVCKIKARSALENAEVILKVNNPGGPPVFAMSTKAKDIKLPLSSGSTVTVEWELDNIFNNGTYIVSAQILDEDGTTIHDEQLESLRFEISGWAFAQSIVHPEDAVRVSSKQT